MLKATALLCSFFALSSYACEPDSLPIRYLETIESMQWQKQKALLHNDARYQDPTMVYYDRPAIDLKGPQAIIDFWESASEQSGTSAIDYTVTACFETAGFYVIAYQIKVETAGDFWNLTQKTVTIPGNVTSIIRLKDDKVVEHIDYVDYDGAQRYIEKLQHRP